MKQNRKMTKYSALRMGLSSYPILMAKYSSHISATGSRFLTLRQASVCRQSIPRFGGRVGQETAKRFMSSALVDEECRYGSGLEIGDRGVRNRPAAWGVD